jgi:hypothetical protein
VRPRAALRGRPTTPRPHVRAVSGGVGLRQLLACQRSWTRRSA